MNALKSILKVFNRNPVNVETDNSQISTNPSNNFNNEAETNEISGDPGLDNAHAPQTDTTLAGQQSLTSEETKEGEGEESRLGGEPGGGYSGNGEPGSDIDISRLIQEAYEKGIIEGRNQQIEEKYFPKKDDGIPVFRGCNPSSNPRPDIFSLASQA